MARRVCKPCWLSGGLFHYHTSLPYLKFTSSVGWRGSDDRNFSSPVHKHTTFRAVRWMNNTQTEDQILHKHFFHTSVFGSHALVHIKTKIDQNRKTTQCEKVTSGCIWHVKRSCGFYCNCNCAKSWRRMTIRYPNLKLIHLAQNSQIPFRFTIKWW